jgi:3-hydroxy-3-methylglutaryl CoA synthase
MQSTSKDCAKWATLKEYAHLSLEESFTNRSLEQASVTASRQEYNDKVAPSTLFPRELGNLYTGSLYSGLASLIYNSHQALAVCQCHTESSLSVSQRLILTGILEYW